MMTELLAFAMGIIVVLVSIIVYQQATKQANEVLLPPSPQVQVQSQLQSQLQSQAQVPSQSQLVSIEKTPVVVHVNTDQNYFTPPVVFGQVGYLSQDGGAMLPLYGEPSQTRRGRYYYYTIVNGIKLSVVYNKRDCMEDVACEEVYDGEQVKVQSMGDAIWTVKIYSNNFVRRYGGYH